ncbi:MAG: NnrS family protein, partial [Elusimicrobiota bacterium]
MATEPRFSFLETLSRNPFRLFFPLGIIAGCAGVGHWAMWTMGYPVADIKNLHLVLQSQGFLSFFVIGFLMTAFPRFSGTNPASLIEISIATAGAVLFLTGALIRHWVLAHTGTLIVLVMIPAFAARRLAHRTKDLPPSFLLLAFGLLQAFLGVIFSLITNMGESNVYLFSIGRQMMQLGFLLCMVLGVTAKLAPFLTGYTNDPGCEDNNRIFCLTKKSEIAAHGISGILIVTSFFLEPAFQRLALGLRATVATIHLIWFAKITRPLKKRTATIFFFWLSCWMIPLGLWLECLLPQYRVAALHVVFIGGFSLMIFSFGMLVVLSHSQKAALLNGKLWALKSVGAMALIALAFRLAADFFPQKYMLFLHSASGFW